MKAVLRLFILTSVFCVLSPAFLSQAFVDNAKPLC
jgi:hypothetical protein